MFGAIGVKFRSVRDPHAPHAIGVVAERPDPTKFQELLQSARDQEAMRDDDLRVETMRMLVEFIP